MLQRKLLVTLGTLIVVLAASAVLAVYLLSGMIEPLDRLQDQAQHRYAQVMLVEDALLQIEALIDSNAEPGLGSGVSDPLRSLQTSLVALEATLPVEAEQRGVHRSEWRHKVQAGLQSLQTTIESPIDGIDTPETMRRSVQHIRAGVAGAMAEAMDRDAIAQNWLTHRLSLIILFVGIGFVVVINVSIALILRASSMIVRPVDELVQASRHLARKEFDHPIPEGRRDEFGEIARAMNEYADSLRQDEALKLETLHQVARMLSHELNNVVAAIDLQLVLASRRSERSDASRQHLHTARASLQRIGNIVQALTHIKRIVLTDYLRGTKMLDLERSIEDAPAPETSRSVSEGAR